MQSHVYNIDPERNFELMVEEGSRFQVVVRGLTLLELLYFK